jgi:hypothetical protein
MIERGFAAVNASLADMRRMHARHRCGDSCRNSSCAPSTPQSPSSSCSGQAMIEDPFQGVRT